MDDIILTEQSDIFPAIIANRIDSDDAIWISLMLFLGKTWIIKGDKFDNRNNINLSMKQYWKGTLK
jgi:hypothetical protein